RPHPAPEREPLSRGRRLLRKGKVMSLLLAFAASLLLSVRPAQEADGAKKDLSPETLSSIHALVLPRESEWRHLRVQWITDVIAAGKKAAAEDKPMVLLYTGGAGYNEPLGVC